MEWVQFRDLHGDFYLVGKWVRLTLSLAYSAWANESLAERAEYQDKMSGTSISNSTQPRSETCLVTLYSNRIGLSCQIACYLTVLQFR